MRNWNPAGRYYDSASEWGQNLSDSFQIEKDQCFGMIAKMVIDNVV
jgi:hypothetical protein